MSAVLSCGSQATLRHTSAAQHCASTVPPRWRRGACQMLESAVARLERVLQRLEETEPFVHAYVDVDRLGAAFEARRIDDAGPGGPLAGRPFAVKEVISVAGLPAAGGSRAFSDHVAGHDATVVGRLRGAGAVLVGTHVAHELTCGLDEPPTRNPWASGLLPGWLQRRRRRLGGRRLGGLRSRHRCRRVGADPCRYDRCGRPQAHGRARECARRRAPRHGTVDRQRGDPCSDPSRRSRLFSSRDRRPRSRRRCDAPCGVHRCASSRRIGRDRWGGLVKAGDSASSATATRAALDARTPPELEVWRFLRCGLRCPPAVSGAELVPVERSRRSKRRPTRSSRFFSTELAAGPPAVSWRTEPPATTPAFSRCSSRALSIPDEPDRRGRRVPSVVYVPRFKRLSADAANSMRWSPPRRPGQPCR